MKLLAFDTSTDTLSIAVGRGSGPDLRQWQTTRWPLDTVSAPAYGSGRLGAKA